FFDIFTALELKRPDTNFYSTYPGWLNEYGPRYANAAAALGPLISELQSVATNPPNSTVSNLVVDTELLQLSLTSISSQMLSGHIGANSAPYRGAATAVSNLQQHLVQMGLELPLPRLGHVATNLQA